MKEIIKRLKRGIKENEVPKKPDEFGIFPGYSPDFQISVRDAKKILEFILKHQ